MIVGQFPTIRLHVHYDGSCSVAETATHPSKGSVAEHGGYKAEDTKVGRFETLNVRNVAGQLAPPRITLGPSS
jgi:hypothetical protein